MIRFGLCCLFLQEPIKFSTTTATSLLRLKRREALAKVSRLCLANAEALGQALVFCHKNGIGCFRVNSQILPVKTHPQAGYDIEECPQREEIVKTFKECGRFARRHDIRLTFHPDQFVVLSTSEEDLIRRSLAEIEYQAQVSQWIGADVINIHGGGAYGDKAQALENLSRNIRRLSPAARRRLTLENDDRTYTPRDLLPVCEKLKVPLVYDVHHHRCLSDGLSEEQATAQALKTWDREPLFHLSSPREGWRGAQPVRHHDYITVKDFPAAWRGLDITVEVEAKAKELAVIRLMKEIKELSHPPRMKKVLRKHEAGHGRSSE